MKTLKIGLFGFGCVGQGLYHTLQHSTGFKTRIEKIVVKNREKLRPIGQEFFSYDKNDILENSDINVVIELIDDAEEAYKIVSTALKNGKNVVTANKKMLALHLETLLALAKENSVSLLYEAAACGSIPIIRTLEEYFDNEELSRISGIFNGTTNYILTKLASENLEFAAALKKAQELGFAESNPESDVEAFDPLYKTIILALHGFGTILKPEQLLRFGITTLKKGDLDFASKNNFKIKLVPSIQRLSGNRLSAYVIPKFIPKEHHLAKVDNEFNGVIVEGQFSGEQFFVGRGAGSLPTGAAVLSDISALSFSYSYENKKLRQQQQPTFSDELKINIYVSSSKAADLEIFPFEETFEDFKKNGFYYRTGKIRLAEIKQLETVVRTRKIFVAEIFEQH
jgi:homoserine dehydrogenase